MNPDLPLLTILKTKLNALRYNLDNTFRYMV